MILPSRRSLFIPLLLQEVAAIRTALPQPRMPTMWSAPKTRFPWFKCRSAMKIIPDSYRPSCRSVESISGPTVRAGMKVISFWTAADEEMTHGDVCPDIRYGLDGTACTVGQGKKREGKIYSRLPYLQQFQASPIISLLQKDISTRYTAATTGDDVVALRVRQPASSSSLYLNMSLAIFRVGRKILIYCQGLWALIKFGVEVCWTSESVMRRANRVL